MPLCLRLVIFGDTRRPASRRVTAKPFAANWQPKMKRINQAYAKLLGKLRSIIAVKDLV